MYIPIISVEYYYSESIICICPLYTNSITLPFTLNKTVDSQNTLQAIFASLFAVSYKGIPPDSLLHVFASSFVQRILFCIDTY